MILNTKNLNRYQKTIEKLTSNGSGIGRSIYLNFKESKAYVLNVQTLAQARIDFDFELEGKETLPKNILLDSNIFKNYYQYTDSLTLKVNKSNVKINYASVNGSMPFMIDDQSFTDESFTVDFEDILTISPESYAKIHLASSWIASSEEDESLESLFIHKDTLYNADGECLYLAPSQELSGITTRLGRDMVSNISIFGENCVVSESEDTTRLVSADGSADYIEPMLLNYELVDEPVSDEFKDSYDGDDKIVVSTEALSEAIAFIEPFTAQQKAKLLLISVEGDNLSLSTESESVGITNKLIPIVSKTQDSYGISTMNLPRWKKALRAIKTSQVELTMNGESIFVRVQGMEEGNRRAENPKPAYADNFLVLCKYT